MARVQKKIPSFAVTFPVPTNKPASKECPNLKQDLPSLLLDISPHSLTKQHASCNTSYVGLNLLRPSGGGRKEVHNRDIKTMTFNEVHHHHGDSRESLLGSAEGAEENIESINSEQDDKISVDGFDQSSPRGVLEIPISSGESDGGSFIGSSSLDRTVASDGLVLESHGLQWKSLFGGLLLRKKKPMRRFSTFPPVTLGSGLQGSSVATVESSEGMEGMGSLPEAARRRPLWRSFDYEELATATDNFSSDDIYAKVRLQDKLIGKGGHAEVYKGCLPDGQLVAVKRLTKGYTEEERIRDFLSELGIVGHVNHPNAAELLGFSVECGLHLVLKFSPHGSLASVLHGSKEVLEWRARYRIALGIAEGLLYLHEGCQRRIIHRDIKASNILLNQEYQPQISDFGLAKWLPEKWTHHVVFPIEGTFGYLAPEYFMHGIVNEKTDIFAFGVLLLELSTGRHAVDSSRKSLVIWAKPLLDANNMNELIDPSLGGDYDLKEMKHTVAAASMCLHHEASMRPNMNWVVQLLRGEEGALEFIRRETRRRPPMVDAYDLEDYTCTTYLNDLHRHKQLAMEQ